jgi:hypothetical protein
MIIYVEVKVILTILVLLKLRTRNRRIHAHDEARRRSRSETFDYNVIDHGIPFGVKTMLIGHGVKGRCQFFVNCLLFATRVTATDLEFFHIPGTQNYF